VLLNASKIVGLNRRQRGCHFHLSNAAIASYGVIAAHLGDIGGRVGLEIGPGDNLGVAECFIANGAERVICVEQFPTVQRNEPMRRLIHEHFGTSSQKTPELILGKFEEVFEEVDFIYSIDVIEHVEDVRVTMRHIARLLRSRGRSVHSVDFSGHNVFAGTGIDFLTCPDWAWNVMHSRLVTSNRVRLSEVLQAANDAGLSVEGVIPTRVVPKDRVEELRPMMNPRFVKLAAEDLCVLEAILSLRAQVAS